MSFGNHTDVAKCVFSQDGNKFATASKICIKVWDVAASKLLRTFVCGDNFSKNFINNIVFDPIDEFLIATRKNTVFVWDLLSGNIWQEFKFGNIQPHQELSLPHWYLRMEYMTLSLDGMCLAIVADELINIYQKTTPLKKPLHKCTFELLVKIRLNYTVNRNTKLFFTGIDTIAIFGRENVVYNVFNGKLLSKIEKISQKGFNTTISSKDNSFLASIEYDVVSIYQLDSLSCKLVNSFDITHVGLKPPLFNYSAISFVLNNTLLAVTNAKYSMISDLYLINFLTGQTIQKMKVTGSTSVSLSNSYNLSVALTRKHSALIVNVTFNRNMLCRVAAVLLRKHVSAYVAMNVVNFCLASNYFQYKTQYDAYQTSFEGESQFLHFLKYNAIEKIKKILKK